jgi:hypothetical protein
MLYNRHNTYFNLIIDSGDEYGVAQTCADNHFCAVKVKFAFVEKVPDSERLLRR